MGVGLAVHVGFPNGAGPPAFKGRVVECWADREDFFLASKTFCFLLGILPYRAS